jgi:ADP-L-glycero-D-manno-heptose 6-epimerase
MILVTGGAGFIGSNIVAALNARGRFDVAVCDFLEHGDKWRNLQKSVFADFVPPAHAVEWLSGRSDVDAVIHMGAISATTATDGDEVIDTNFRFSLALLNHCTRAGIPFLYASSAAVYGEGDQGFEDSIDPDEIRKLRPLNLYGWSKRQFDFVVADRIARAAPMPPVCVGFRFFNVFGPNEYHKGDMKSIVAKIAGPIGRGETITLFKSHRAGIGDGDQRRDFIYVKDAVEAVLSFLQPGGRSGIFNVGTGQARSFRELAEAVFLAFGLEPRIDYIDMPEAIRDKYQYFTEASLGNLRQSGFAAPFPRLEDAVADYVGSHLRQEDPYR